MSINNRKETTNVSPFRLHISIVTSAHFTSSYLRNSSYSKFQKGISSINELPVHVNTQP